jgi:CRISPR-associated protein Cas1
MRLRETASNPLIERIAMNFNRMVPYKGKNFSYQSILFDAVQQLANFILGKKNDVQFSVPLFDIKRETTIALTEKILAISPNERKRLGINKSTLWYQKKNLERGKSIKVYGKVLSKLI